MNIITPDLLPALCASLTCPRALARLSETCKAARKYLLSPAGGHHWASAARAVCGDDHAQFGTTRPEHLRYAAIVDLDGKTAFEHFCTHPSAPRFAATLRALA